MGYIRNYKRFKRKVLVSASIVLLTMLVAIIFVQTFLVEESLRTSKLIFDSAVKQSMEKAVNHLNTDNIKKYLLDTDKSTWQRYKKIDEINDRIKELKTDYPTLFLKCEGYTEKDWENLSKLSPKDSLVLEMYHDLSKKRDMLRDTTFTLGDYAEYFLNFTTKYNVLDISELDYEFIFWDFVVSFILFDYVSIFVLEF